MNDTVLHDFKLAYTFAADWLADLDRQLAFLLSTREGTVPLDREFGLNMDFVHVMNRVKWCLKPQYACRSPGDLVQLFSIFIDFLSTCRTKYGRKQP